MVKGDITVLNDNKFKERVYTKEGIGIVCYESYPINKHYIIIECIGDSVVLVKVKSLGCKNRLATVQLFLKCKNDDEHRLKILDNFLASCIDLISNLGK